VLLVVVLVLVVCGGAVYKTVDKYRINFAASDVSVPIIAYLLVSAFRKLIPPVYYALPLGSVFMTVLADTLGSSEGAAVYQVSGFPVH
jgi:hypothetical protein